LCDSAEAVFLFDIVDADGGGDGVAGKQEGSGA